MNPNMKQNKNICTSIHKINVLHILLKEEKENIYEFACKRYFLCS